LLLLLIRVIRVMLVMQVLLRPMPTRKARHLD
jgi:hypothetical protein